MYNYTTATSYSWDFNDLTKVDTRTGKQSGESAEYVINMKCKRCRGAQQHRLVMRAFDSFHYRYREQFVRELETTETPGYWRFRTVCRGECRAGHKRPMRHTAYYAEHGDRDNKGRFISPFRAWRAWRNMEHSDQVEFQEGSE